ncbi:putative inorganic phosphate cotransporter isoform X1 [Neodiprion lecontei]|uniref:Putative inorganic phosphate cotransporter n=1 Tax=Neodiprion lecontei TaxID=441921 RepID=A0A6J0CDN5_NEOLC|nr:putative inorganic phosphate cotransporter isoform X1 [Neodiprion lecontei]XP_046596031.1 putative inorganic phosphate cotransporter isoform X1 [Neodiprion lecontei]
MAPQATALSTAPPASGEDGTVKSKTQGVKPSATFGSRHFQALLMFLGLSCGYTVRVNMSVAIVAMTSDEDTPTNGNFDTYNWEPSVQSLILSSFFWGYVLIQVPAGLIAQRFGARKLLAIAVFICGGISLLIPAAARYGGWIFVCFCRVLMGLCQGCVLPSLHTLLSKWAPPEERGRLGSFVYAGHQFGTLVALPISGFLAGSSAGWPSVFYLWGTVTIAWSIWWFFYGADSPANHPSISSEERQYIELSLRTSDCQDQLPESDPTTTKVLSTPWKAIFTSQPMWALLVVHCAQTWGFWMLLTEIPTYLHAILDFNIKENGLISALPYLVMWILSFPTSYISDWTLKRGWVSTGKSRKICNTIGHWIPAIALIALGYVDKSQTVLAVAILVIAVAFNVGTLCGYQVNHMDLSPNFAGTLMGMTNGTANIFAILAPLITGFIVTNPHEVAQWRTVFFISSGFYFLGNLFFMLFGSGDIQWWNEPSRTDSIPNRKMSEKCDQISPASYRKANDSLQLEKISHKERY